GEHSARGNPTRAAPHHFNKTAGTVMGRHAADIGRNFHDRRAIVFNDRAVTGAMVGVRQVIINRFGNAVDAQLVSAGDGLLVNFVGGILGIVAADIKEVADVVGFKNVEEPIHGFGGLLQAVFEI